MRRARILLYCLPVILVACQESSIISTETPALLSLSTANDDWSRVSLAPLRWIPSLGNRTSVGAKGEVVGEMGNSRATLWDGKQFEDLGVYRLTPAGFGGSIELNSKGDVLIGLATESGNASLEPSAAYLWSKGSYTRLTTFDAEFAAGNDINKTGAVVGTRYADGRHRAIVWHNGTVTKLGTLSGDNGSIGVAINDRGEVLGVSYGGEVPGSKPFIWTNGAMTAIPTGGESVVVNRMLLNEDGTFAIGLGDGFLFGDASSVEKVDAPEGGMTLRNLSEGGEVVGNFGIDGNIRAFHWRNGHMTVLDNPAGCANALAFAAVDESLIVGVANGCESGENQAVVWESGQPRILETGVAWGVSENGIVVVRAADGTLALWSSTKHLRAPWVD
jgi:probable HAF family extracellular repeat protein